jgi:DNA-binding HxlR family transcriptional regulator
MRSDDAHLGESTLLLLADSRTLAILGELAGETLRPGELDLRLPELPHAGLMRRLHRLTLARVVMRERRRESPPRTDYSLTEAGRELVGIPGLATRWEREWRPLNGWLRPSGAWALRQIADRRTRAILMALADGPLRPGELRRLLPGVGHSAIMRCLPELALNGIVIRHAPSGGKRQVRYELTDHARRLGLPALLAACWEWRWARPADPTVTGDLDGLVHMLAPLTRTPGTLEGACRLHFVWEGALPESSVNLAVSGGRLAVLAPSPSEPPVAQGRACPQAWCESLLAGRPVGVAVAGDGELLAAVLEGLRDVLLA